MMLRQVVWIGLPGSKMFTRLLDAVNWLLDTGEAMHYKQGRSTYCFRSSDDEKHPVIPSQNRLHMRL